MGLIFLTHKGKVLKPNSTEKLCREPPLRQQYRPLEIRRLQMFMPFYQTKGSYRADVYFSGSGSRVTIIMK